MLTHVMMYDNINDMKKNKVRFTFYIDSQAKKELEEIHKKIGISVAEQCRRAVNNWLEKMKYDKKD
jgi:hypothetical protein